MKSNSATFGGTPSNREQTQRAAGRSQTRVSATGDARIERGRWASCEGPALAGADHATALPEAPGARRGGPEPAGYPRSEAEQQRVARARAEEPRTGVVRRVDFSSGERGAGVTGRGLARTAPASGRREQSPTPVIAPTGNEAAAGSARDWSCLEWGRAGKERLLPRRGKRNSKVTIVQLSRGGDLVRQNGPDAWLPEAGDFMHRMAGLVAQGLGFGQCRSVCLKNATAVLTVAEAGGKVVAVSGPVSSMTNVLRRAGLE